MRNFEKPDFESMRQYMVKHQLENRGINSPLVLRAMARVARERFLPAELQEFAYADSPLPIAEGQTISQPYVTALMLEALNLRGGEQILKVGTGSGYAAAVLAEIPTRVYTLEHLHGLTHQARRALRDQGYTNVKVIHDDGSRGYQAAAPYDGILVSAGSPGVPDSLKQQLKPGGRLVIPVGDRDSQTLRCIIREHNGFREEDIGFVHFVPLVGREGWHSDPQPLRDSGRKEKPEDKHASTGALIAAVAEPIASLEETDLGNLLERIGDARVVLLGEASHGSSEFYQFRARITRELIEHKGFNMVAVEADWPDAAHIDHYVRQLTRPPSEWRAFTRFPTWMWRNTDFQEFVEWLRRYNAGFIHQEKRVAFYGLDLYSMFTSIDEILKYLDGIDPVTARIARERYGCLTPWQSDPATYGRAALTGRYRECEPQVTAMLVDLMEKEYDYTALDGTSFLDAVQNARLVANAEEYYRSLYSGYSDSWNLRDSHMFDTICSLLDYEGEQGKIVVWEHNSHIGDARATDMAARCQHNVGQLCRQKFGEQTYLIGFGTHTGTVAAADDWSAPMQVKEVKPSLEGSWEHLCHDTNIPAFMLPLKSPGSRELRRRLDQERPERAIGVIYRPETEWASHYFHARLRRQFDEYIWFDETRAVTSLDAEEMQGMPDTYPFGL